MVYQIIFRLENGQIATVFGDLVQELWDEYKKKNDDFANDKNYWESRLKEGIFMNLQELNDRMERKGFDLVMLTDYIAIFRLRPWWENLKIKLGLRT